MATAREQLAQFAAGSKALGRLCREYKNRSATVHLEELVGGALSFYAAAAVAESGGVHVFVAEDRDAAAYLLNDFYNLLDERQVYFFPSSWKRSAAYGAEDAQGVVQRTATMHAVRNFTGKGYLVVCTCPEALAERVADAEALQRETITVRVGDRISIEVLEQALVDASFTRVDFVYEPGQYSVRGGIVDVFSYSESKPYRLDFFGDEVDSIRRFNISSQLSSDRLERVEIIPDLNAGTPAAAKVSFARFAGAEASWWFYDADFVLRRVNDIRRRTLSDMEHPDEIDSLLTSRNSLVADLSGSRIFLLRDNLPERPAAATVKFATSPQPKFNKNFEMLADDMIRGALRGYDTYILSENKAQVERLENIFHQIGRGQAVVRSLSTTLHEGFVDNDLKLCLYTDHQIFDRYQRYRINGEIRRDEQMTVAELNQLRPGDYVVHIDHGVGRFDGLVKIAAGDGRMQEAIKLVYKDGDVLFVNVHSLHRISRYKSGDGEPPKVYKLGNGAWQKLKNATKKAVKDISRELIALYAKRKASKGYAFSHDSYLQHELEASFRWEDTPDQQSATAAIKKDMESDQPMDRLVCGDVGFGKTEVAIRAAFKAAVDGKQVAVLVPTTILALQHYRSFTERLRDFPVRVEYINRTKSTKEVSQIREDLASGKIDILIGTHKMLGKQIVFRDLGLLIIDEEQKFGVAAKEKLTEMSVSVDTLTLTATPIPRTLNMALSGIRDMSVLEEAPQDRVPVQTYVAEYDDVLLREAVRRELRRGGQVFYLHNSIDTVYAKAASIGRDFPDASIAVAHGKMSKEELSEVWQGMVNGEVDVLVCTTIIETGIDVPNANTLIIEDADRMGLSQLHQIRGRVGRSSRKAYAYFTYRRGGLLSEIASKRLQAVREFTEFGSGFKIAMRDLELRGAGNLLGAEQSGCMEAVGYDLYIKILEDAVNAEKGIYIPSVRDCLIDINVNAYIADAYIPSSKQRIDVYRKIAHLESADERDDLLDELSDRYGELPAPVSNLVDISLLRNAASLLGFASVEQKGALLSFFSDAPDMERIAALAMLPELRGRITASGGKRSHFSYRLEKGENRLTAARRVLELYTKLSQKGIDKSEELRYNNL